MKTLQVDNIIRGLPPILTENDVCSLDLELSGLRDNQLHRPAGHMVSLAGSFDGRTAYIIQDEDEVQEFLNRIEKATWVFHNSVFDLAHLSRWAKITERVNMHDTLLIERILFSNYYDDFDLKSLVRRYLGCYMPKDVRKEFKEHDGAMTDEQISYAAGDVIGTWLVDQEQQKIISHTDRAIWDKLYNPHVWTVLELGGLKLDTEMWRDLADKYQLVVDEIGEQLGKKYGKTVEKIKYTKRLPAYPKGKMAYNEDNELVEAIPPSEERLKEYESRLEEYQASKTIVQEFVSLNLNSPIQVKKVLLDTYKLNLESTDEDSLRPYYDKNEFVNKLLDYRKAEKQTSTYGLPFLKNVEDDGRIYSSLNIGLATTGRDCVHGDTILQTTLGDFAISDLDLSKDLEYRIVSHTGMPRKILNKFYKGKEMMYQVTLQNGDYIKCTIGHIFRGNPCWMHLYEMGIGTEVMVPDGLSIICDVSPIGIQDVWDIEVETDHSYVAQGFVNHNSSSSPNLQNIPSTKERRECFVAGEGKKLVLYDYSGQEAGIWAYITGDEKFKEIINSGKKLYIEVARIAFNEEIQKGTPRYAIIKALVLGLMYGLTPWGFARDNGVDIETAEDMFNAFFKGFPSSARWMQEKQKYNHVVSKSILGRSIHLHPYDSQWKNNSLNDPMQGSGSDMIKLAMRNLRRTDFYKQYHPEGRVDLLLQVHDEIMSEVDELLAPEWAELMKKVMIDTAESLTPGIKANVSGGIISSWAEKS